jgi:hypothetical protein
MEDFSLYFGLGWHHIISWDALDHILFILALTVIYRIADWKKLLVLVTAFTIGHFITLFLSVTDILRVSSGLVEFLIPVTIMITAVFDLFQKKFSTLTLRVNYLLALCFGLIHGLGYANAIRFMLMKGERLGPNLFAFNIGLEIGQIVVVLTALFIGEAVLRSKIISRRVWVIIISTLVLVVALNMVIDRLPNM